jgi:hypothetical protein
LFWGDLIRQACNLQAHDSLSTSESAAGERRSPGQLPDTDNLSAEKTAIEKTLMLIRLLLLRQFDDLDRHARERMNVYGGQMGR